MKILKYLLLGLVSLGLVACNDSDSDSQVTAPPSGEIISLNVESAIESVVVGEKLQFTAVLVNTTKNTAIDVTAKTTWRSTNTAVATIDRNTGLATAVAVGETLIIGTFDGRESAGSKLTVTALTSVLPPTPPTNPSANLTSITVEAADPPKTQFVVGTSLQLRAVGNLSDGSKTDLTNAVTWAAVTPATISVTQAGLATALAAGTATVSATYTASVPAPVVGTLSGTSVAATIQQLIVDGAHEATVGVTIPLEAVAVYNNNADPVDVTKQATWTSSNPAVATVDAQGIVLGVAAGDAIITATFQGASAQHPVRYRAPELVSLVMYNGSLENYYTTPPINGTTQQLYVVDDVSWPYEPEGLDPNAYYPVIIANYADGSQQDVTPDINASGTPEPGRAVLTSSRPQQVYVSSRKGPFVFGKEVATATITARFGGKEASFIANVNPQAGAPTLQAIILKNSVGTVVNFTTFDLPVGNKEWVTAYGRYSDGTLQNINAKVNYRSTAPRTAYVFDSQDSNIRGLNVGTADIIAEWQGQRGIVTANVVAAGTPVLQRIELQENANDPCVDPCRIIDTSGSNNLQLKPGGTQYITAWAIYSGSTSRTYINKDARWTSADYSIASMPLSQSSSVVTGVAQGSTTVTANYGGLTGSANVVVAP